MNRKLSQSGSAFWIILIAIMIFGGLSYAVMQGRSGSVTALTNDQARVAAAEIIAYGDTLAKTVQTLKLRGCADTQFDFTNTIWQTNDGTPTIPTNPTAVSGCGVFKSGEGNAQIVVFPASYIYDWTGAGPSNWKVGASGVQITELPGVGNNTKEDVFLTVGRINNQVCMMINNILGVENLVTGPPIGTQYNANYAGGFLDNSTHTFTDVSGKLAGKNAFCYQESTLAPYHLRYWRVLITR